MKCVRCYQDLPEGVGSFCPYCGQVNLSDSVIYNYTTANHDPLNRDFKPWRDKPLVPVRNYIIRNSSKKKWLPTIKPPSSAVKKIILEQKPTLETVALSDAESLLSSTTKSLTVSIDQDDALSIASSKTNISDINIFSIELLFSLVEQTFVADREKCRLHWLKVSANIKNKQHNPPDSGKKEDATDDISDIENEDDECENWRDLCFISNIGGKLIAMENKQNWIDLPSIDAEEYYMAKHVQQILQPICYRYKQYIDTLRPSIHYDVVCKKQVAMSRYHSVLSNYSPSKSNEIIVPKTIITYLSQHYKNVDEDEKELEVDGKQDHKSSEGRQNQPVAEGKDQFAPTAILPEIDRFYLDDTFMQWEEDIRVKQPNTVLFCKLLVKIKALYQNRFQFSQHSSAQNKEFTYDSFRQGAQPTHIEITLQSPIHYDEFHFPIVIIRFENDILKHLLKSEANIHDVFEESSEHSSSVVVDYFQKILSLIRLCYTSQGIQYEIVGSFPEPPIRYLPWPSDIAQILNIVDDDLNASDED